MNLPKVSIIIPAYNIEAYIEECLFSVLKQSYQNIEVIVINDGSSDNTLTTIENVFLSDSRVRLISQSNAGVSVARNTGLDAATGDYVVFIDGDDWVEPNFVESIVSYALTTGSDVIKGGFRFVDKENGKSRISHMSSSVRILSSNESLDAFLLGQISVCVWGGGFKRSIISEHKLMFQEGVKIGEDGDFYIRYLCLCKQLTLMPEAGYNVRVRLGSATRSGKKTFHQDHSDIYSNAIYENLVRYDKYLHHVETYNAYILRSKCSQILKQTNIFSLREFLHIYNNIYSKISSYNTFEIRRQLPFQIRICAYLCKFPRLLYCITHFPLIKQYTSLR